MAKRAKTRWFAMQWRKHRGYNMEKAAERLGVSVGHLSDLEKGKKRWNQDHIEAMAEAYNCEPADILMRDPSEPSAIWSIWDQIPPTQRTQAAELLRVLIKKAS